jgi:propionyl-CoA synthetase
VVRDNGGHAVALKWSMKAIYNVDAGEVYWAASDVGWVVGHSYIVYAPLLKGCATVLFEGKPVGTPDAGVFWRVISQHKVGTMFTAPTAFRAIKREDPEGRLIKRYDLSHFRALFLAGERLDPDTLKWARTQLRVPVIDHWWQTETGWAICANCLGLHAYPVKEGSPTKAGAGLEPASPGSGYQTRAAGEIGALVVKLPLPPGTLPTLWNNDRRFVNPTWKNFPAAIKPPMPVSSMTEGYVYVMARTDDIINVAGHRLSTGAMEEVLSDHPAVAECAVLGVDDDLKGQVPVGFLVLKAGVRQADEQVVAEVIQMVRDRIGPVAAFKKATVVKRLPKTRSGKILRGTIQNIADNKAYTVPPTIDDPVILEEIETALNTIGLGKARPGRVHLPWHAFCCPVNRMQAGLWTRTQFGPPARQVVTGQGLTHSKRKGAYEKKTACCRGWFHSCQPGLGLRGRPGVRPG